MSVIYKVVTRPSDPRVPNSPKKYYPHLITLGQSVNLKYIAQKMQGYSSLSIGDIKSVIQNFVYADCLFERSGCSERCQC